MKFSSLAIFFGKLLKGFPYLKSCSTSTASGHGRVGGWRVLFSPRSGNEIMYVVFCGFFVSYPLGGYVKTCSPSHFSNSPDSFLMFFVIVLYVFLYKKYSPFWFYLFHCVLMLMWACLNAWTNLPDPVAPPYCQENREGEEIGTFHVLWQKITKYIKTAK